MKFSRALSEIAAVALIAAFLFMIPVAFVGAADQPLTTTELKTAYMNAQAGGQKVRILVMPGHEPGYGGTEFAGYYERELVVVLANDIATELRKDPSLEVLVARGTEGWNEDLERYFDRSMRTIERFLEAKKKETRKLVRKGDIDTDTEQASHNRAPDDVALRLYGITKWSNDNDVDLMIHVHLNDSGGHASNVPGTYTGLTVYVPDKGYGNAKPSREIGEAVFKRLNTLSATSTLPIEDKGVVEDRGLIALGANNTSLVPSVLIEYGYIYEPKFLNETVRPAVFRDMAYATARGVRKFFGTSAIEKYDTRALPHTWTKDATATSTTATQNVDLYALQAALRSLGFYPPSPSTLINCPVDGVMSACVTDAVKAFQASKGLEATGTLGPATRNALNALFSAGPVVAEPVPSSVTAASPTIGSCKAFPPGLKIGSTGSEVSRLQTLLAKDRMLYPGGQITGYYGPATDAAVKNLQLMKALTTKGSAIHGTVGPATSKALCAIQ